MLCSQEITGYTKEDGTVVEPKKFNQVAMVYSEDKVRAQATCVLS